MERHARGSCDVSSRVPNTMGPAESTTWPASFLASSAFAVAVQHAFHGMHAAALFEVQQRRVVGQRLHQPVVAVSRRRDAIAPPLVRHLVCLQHVLKEHFGRGAGRLIRVPGTDLQVRQRRKVDQAREALSEGAGNRRDRQVRQRGRSEPRSHELHGRSHFACERLQVFDRVWDALFERRHRIQRVGTAARNAAAPSETV